MDGSAEEATSAALVTWRKVPAEHARPVLDLQHFEPSGSVLLHVANQKAICLTMKGAANGDNLGVYFLGALQNGGCPFSFHLKTPKTGGPSTRPSRANGFPLLRCACCCSKAPNSVKATAALRGPLAFHKSLNAATYEVS